MIVYIILPITVSIYKTLIIGLRTPIGGEP